jgi:hypothetical protein
MVRESGELFVTTLSGASVMAKVSRFYPAHMPITVKISSRTTNNGYDVQNCAILAYNKESVLV